MHSEKFKIYKNHGNKQLVKKSIWIKIRKLSQLMHFSELYIKYSVYMSQHICVRKKKKKRHGQWIFYSSDNDEVLLGKSFSTNKIRQLEEIKEKAPLSTSISRAIVEVLNIWCFFTFAYKYILGNVNYLLNTF